MIQRQAQRRAVEAERSMRETPDEGDQSSE
jgi:hypothetical protein